MQTSLARRGRRLAAVSKRLRQAARATSHRADLATPPTDDSDWR
jgi:hypothetical protein